MMEEHGLDALEHFGGLGGVRAGTNFEIDVWSGNAHLAEENVGELLVIVLTCVDENGFNFRMTAHLPDKWGDFGEVWTRSHDVEDFQRFAHSGYSGEARAV